MEYKAKDGIKNGIEFIICASTIFYIKFTEISNQFVSGNVPDALFPIGNYTYGRLTFLEKPSLLWATIIGTAGTMAEVAQYFGLCPGTFDIKDIPMYFLGAGIAYGFDKITFNKQKYDLEEKLNDTQTPITN